MTALTIVYWRDIPAQVIVGAGRKKAKRQLDARFQEAIDSAAMRSGAHGTDAYLADWRRGDSENCGDDLQAEADAAVVRLDGAYPEDRLTALVLSGGAEEA